MKNNIFIFIIFLMVFSLYQSCQKDDVLVAGKNQSAFSGVSADYDEFGAKLEKVISNAISDREFKKLLIEQLQTKPLGDTEMLLSTFLQQSGVDVPEQALEILLTFAGDLFTKEELNVFLVNYPSFVIAFRGPEQSWQYGEHTPPVVFLSSDFTEKQLSLSGTKSGETVQVDVSKPFEDAVVALHLSERHDRNGTPYYLTQAGDPNRFVGLYDDKKADDDDDDLVKTTQPQTNCFPAFNCSQVQSIVLEEFSVVPQNGGLYLSYLINNPTGICLEPIKIEIRRTNPNGSTTLIEERTGLDFPGFYDSDITPGSQYIYTIEMYVSLYNIFQEPPGYETCISTTMSESISAPALAGQVTDFIGDNFSNTNLFYSWQPPAAGVNEYEVRRWGGTSWEQVALLPGTQTSYQYQYGSEDRDNSVYISVRHRASGPWSESVYDESKGSFRNQGSNLMFYGMYAPGIQQYEQNGGESPILGNPEFRVVASKGTSPSSVAIIQEYIAPTTRCQSPWYTEYYFDPFLNELFEFEYQIPLDYYVPIDGSIPIIQGWNSDLYGQYVTVEISETDVLEITAAGGTISSQESKSLSTKIGVKVLGIGLGAQVGYNQSTETKETTRVLYPSSDVEIGHKVYSYNEPVESEFDGMFFGSDYIEDLCCYFHQTVTTQIEECQ